MNKKLSVAFGVVTRDDCGRERAQTVIDRWDVDAPVLVQKGVSCVATARCLLGAEMATNLPSDVECVVLLDDDVSPSSAALLSIISSTVFSARAGHPTIFAASYPLRLPVPDQGDIPRSDNRIAHDIWKHGVSISGGLGCVAIPSALFRWIHLGDWTTHYSIMGGGVPSTCPYRVGPRHGIWMTEDVYFWSVLRELSIPSKLIPVVVKHGTLSGAPGWTQLNGMPLSAGVLFE